MAYERVTFAWAKYIYNHFPGGASATQDGEPPYVNGGNQSAGWITGFTYTRYAVAHTDGSTIQWESLQDGNLNNDPHATEGVWWKRTTGWKELDHIVQPVPGYIKSTGMTPGGTYDNHINNPSLTTWAWQYFTKDAGPHQAAMCPLNAGGRVTLRQSPTEATCYSAISEEDGYGGATVTVSRFRAGVETVLAYVGVSRVPSTMWRFMVLGVGPYMARLVLQRDVLESGASLGVHSAETWVSAATPSGDTWDTVWTFDDAAPTTYAEGPFMGFRQPPSSTIHEASCGSVGLLTANPGPVTSGSVTLSGTRVPGSTVVVS